MLLKMECSLDFILPSVDASRLAKDFFVFFLTGLFILLASPAVALPHQHTAVHNTDCCLLQREDCECQSNQRKRCEKWFS